MLGTVPLRSVHEATVHFVSRDGNPITVEVTGPSKQGDVDVVTDKSPSPQLTVRIRPTKPGIWQQTLKVKAHTSTSTQPIEIKCVAFYSHNARGRRAIEFDSCQRKPL